MTNNGFPPDFSPGLRFFVETVGADDRLRAAFTALFDDADSETGRAAIIATAAKAGVPITVDDIVALRKVADDETLSDDALDQVGGGRYYVSWFYRPPKVVVRP